MARAENLVGRRFGRLLVVERAENKSGKTRWLCECDCGNTTFVRSGLLKNGTTKSCGCLRDEKLQEYRCKIRKEKTKSTKGYVLVFRPYHPRANRGRVFEHIAVWEEHNKTQIPDGYIIHHINGDKSDNRIENLALMTIEEHTILHSMGKKRTDETKEKISVSAKERFSNPRNHPRYKDVSISDLVEEVKEGRTVESVCDKYGICKKTYYKKKYKMERGI